MRWPHAAAASRQLVERTETLTSAAGARRLPGTPFVVMTDAQPITLFIAPEQHTAMSETTQAALPGKTAWSTGWS
jgi:hypothetical protein